MNINLIQIHAFLAVADLGSVQKAADALHVTQPAISTRIKNLESCLDCTLFDRPNGNMKLTSKGVQFLEHAKGIAILLKKIEVEVIDPGSLKRKLRIGVSETIAETWLVPLIKALRHAYPLIILEISIDISINLRRKILNNEVEIAILLGPVIEYKIGNTATPAFELTWYRSPSLERDETAGQIFHTQPIVSYAKDTRPLINIRNEIFNRYGFQAVLFPSASLSASFKLIAQGLCIGALPRVIGEDYVQSGELEEFDPGWRPEALTFTISRRSDPIDPFLEAVTVLALDAAHIYWA